MPKEIERKFLLRDESWKDGSAGCHYVQGYLSLDPARTVRIRKAGLSAFLTIKGISQGTTRLEFEYPIPLPDAEALLAMSVSPLVEKVRYTIEYHGKRWEVDEFFGDNEGLILAEIELSREDEPFDAPPWVGREVSQDRRYYNASLSAHPFRNWR
jgi:adenylate cyclase